MRPFKAISTAAQQGGSMLLDRVIESIGASFASLAGAVTNDVLFIQDIPTGVDVKVFHGMAAPPRTWEVCGKDANADVWESSTDNPRRGEYLLMRSSADVTVTLRFS